MACKSDRQRQNKARLNEQEMVKAKMIFCLKCGDHFEIVEDLFAHVKANLNCKTKPNLQFLSRQGHKLEKDTEDEKYSKKTHIEFNCAFCDKVFKDKSRLDSHVTSFHTDASEKKKCAMCDYRYHHERNLISHIDRVHRGLKDTQECPICKKEFTKTCLKVHIASVHEGKLPYQCSICSKRFSQKPNWMRHEKEVHSIKHRQHFRQGFIKERLPNSFVFFRVKMFAIKFFCTCLVFSSVF